jgi:hypothetical protein
MAFWEKRRQVKAKKSGEITSSPPGYIVDLKRLAFGRALLFFRHHRVFDQFNRRAAIT